MGQAIAPATGAGRVAPVLLAVILTACADTDPGEPPLARLAAASDRVPDGYVGNGACVPCHGEIVRGYEATKKGRSLTVFDPRAAPERLPSRSAVVDTLSGLRYEALLHDGRLVQREFRQDEDGLLLHQLELAADLVIGSGNQTRSYLMVRNGLITQMPLTWYTLREDWDLSPGYHEANDRFSRKIALECLHCHGDTPRRSPHTQNHYTGVPGAISCERCHGPGAAHVAARGRGEGPGSGEVDPWIVNPAHLERDRALSVCAQCHLAGIMTYAPGEGPATFLPGMHLAEHRTVYVPELQLTDPDWVGIDSHPVRLARSACFRDSPMTCTTCHVSHTPDVDLPRAHYNNRCLVCHSPAGGGEAPVCARPEVHRGAHATSGDCVGCHMQAGGTSDVPHVRFTDHWIRREPGPPLSPDAGRPVIESRDPLRLVPLSPRGTAASPDLYRHLPESVRLAGEAEAYFHCWETMHRHPDYLPRVAGLGRQALARGAGTAEGRLALGRALLQMDSVRAAEAVFRELMAMAPANPWAHLFLGAVLDERLRRPADAVPHLERAVELQPELLEARRKLAEALYGAGRRVDAAEQLEALVERDPVHEPGAWFNLGVVRSELGDLDAATRAFREASRLAPDLAPAHLAIGSIHLSAGRLDSAETAFRAAVVASPDSPEAHGSLALVDIQRGDLAHARQHLERVLELDPGNRQARALLDELDELL